jgi:hypothetical protein
MSPGAIALRTGDDTLSIEVDPSGRRSSSATESRAGIRSSVVNIAQKGVQTAKDRT